MAFTLNSYKVKGFSSSIFVFVSFLEYMFYIDLKLLSVDIFSSFNYVYLKKSGYTYMIKHSELLEFCTCTA